MVFDWRVSRRHGELTSLIDGFAGLLQSDGYEAYAAVLALLPAMTSLDNLEALTPVRWQPASFR